MRPLLLAVPLLLAAAPAAHAAEVHTDRDCYLQTDKTTVSVAASGFPAGQPYTVAVDDLPLSGTNTIGADGTMTGAFNPPALEDAENQRVFDLAVESAGQRAATRFTVTRFKASFSPSKGDPARLKVRFSAFGFGLGQANPAIYVHYVAPNGRVRTTVRLGRAQGQCGAIPRTAKRRLFPFARPAHGTWRLQFDTSKRYRKGTQKSPFLFYALGVRVRSA